MITAALVDRLQDRDIGRIFDLAARIARRQLDILDNLVQRIARIDLAISGAIDLFVLSDRSETRVPKRGRRGTEVDPCNARVGTRDAADNRQSDR